METWYENLQRWLPLETMLRLLVAIAAGALIGWEREWREKPAGLRTHMLVALGSAAFILSAIELSVGMGDESTAMRLDPIRALAGIIGGVGFLGAGTIIQARGSVRGLTTAASIWLSAAIGTSCGMGLYRLAFTAGLLALCVLWAIGSLERSVLRTKAASSDEV